MTEEEILLKIVKLIPDYLMEGVKVGVAINKSDYNSITIKTKPSPYCMQLKEFLFARIKTTGTNQYVSFSSKFKTLFDDINIPYSQIKSSPDFVRIKLSDFDEFLKNQSAPDILQKIYMNAFSFDPFGCCSRYLECSDLKRCVHPDIVYATACQYRKNLENGAIFYGKNKTF
ncbi:MAG: hypothetical protein KH284_07760 [Clostridiales bacterium]|nr:hypothetical protein [Clostridiales bacterium]